MKWVPPGSKHERCPRLDGKAVLDFAHLHHAVGRHGGLMQLDRFGLGVRADLSTSSVAPLLAMVM